MYLIIIITLIIIIEHNYHLSSFVNSMLDKHIEFVSSVGRYYPQKCSSMRNIIEQYRIDRSKTVMFNSVK